MHFTIVLLFAAALLPAQPGRFGLPACDGPDLELAVHPGFFLCYDSSRKLPLWAVHQLSLPPAGHPAPPRPRFRPDLALTRPTATHRDFTHSGFHRGHLVPAADLAADVTAYQDSFLLSNVIPQPPAINNGVWRRLENLIRSFARHADTVIVITGTLSTNPSPLTLGPGQVHVPSHVFKAVLALSGPHLRMFAALVPNDPAVLPACLPELLTTVDQLELLTGLDFFAVLDDATEQALESTPAALPTAPEGVPNHACATTRAKR